MRSYLHDKIECVACTTYGSCTAKERFVGEHPTEMIKGGKIVAGIVDNTTEELHQELEYKAGK